MSELIVIERDVAQEKLEEINVFSWPIWSKEISEFSWSYDENETCYILEGSAEVIPEGEEVGTRIEKGDFVIFNKGLKCIWKITQPLKKHYSFI